jgi:hypothetical protein
MQSRISLGPHVALGVDASATPEEIRTAFLGLTKTFHPARFGRMSTEIQKLSNEVFLGIKGAHEALLKTLGVPIRTPASGSGAFPRSASPPPERTTQRIPQISPVSRPLTPAFGVKIGSRPSTPPNTPPSAPPPTAPAPAASQPAPNEQVELQRALDLMTARNWSAAQQAVTMLMARTQPAPKQYRALLCYTRGRAAQEAGKREEAVMEMQRALQLDPDLGQAKSALEELLRRR